MNLITGSTGIVGIRIMFDLLSMGEEVRGLKRKTSDLSYVKKVFCFYDPQRGDELFDKINWVDGDVNDLASLELAFEGVSHCYHAAALVSYRSRDFDNLIQTNAQGTANVVNTALDFAVSKFCHISSVAALGRAENGELTTEADHWTREKNKSGYSMSKYMAEREMWRAMAEGLPGVIVNPGVILGPSKPQQSSGMLMAVLKKGVAFYPKGVVGYVDVRDVSKAAIELMHSDITNKRFLLVSENKNYFDFLSAAALVFGNVAPRIKLRPWMLEIAWRAAAVLGLLLQKPPKITKEVVRSASKKNAFSSQKLKDAISYQFVPIDESLLYYRAFFD